MLNLLIGIVIFGFGKYKKHTNGKTSMLSVGCDLKLHWRIILHALCMCCASVITYLHVLAKHKDRLKVLPFNVHTLTASDHESTAIKVEHCSFIQRRVQ